MNAGPLGTAALAPAVQPAKGRGVGAADPRALAAALSRYRACDPARSRHELLVTAVPFAASWGLMAYALASGVWAGVLLAVPTAAFLVRLFMIQHDCGHGAFLPGRRANDWIGRAIGVLTLTPYDEWRRTHALHHAGSGHLGRRGVGDVATLTVREYRALSRLGRLRYRAYRHPLVMFGMGPLYVFVLQHRFPDGPLRAGAGPWVSAMATNVAIAVLAAVSIALLGWPVFLAVQLPVVALAAAAGVWLFYVQHQFETTSWEEEGAWRFHEAALEGSSHYDLPPVLRWFSANIGLHHVHHLVSRIPFYRLPEVLRDFPELGNVNRLTLRASLACPRLTLWDEDRRRLVSFADEAAARGGCGPPAGRGGDAASGADAVRAALPPSGLLRNDETRRIRRKD